MNLVTLANELKAAAATITGLRVYATPGMKISAPALVVGYPTAVEFDQTFGRGSDRLQLTLFLLVGRTSARSGGVDLLGYLSGSGPGSIKAAIEGASYTAADVVHVDSASVGAITAEGVEYLGATFETTVTGRG